jgi:hypothetical protein
MIRILFSLTIITACNSGGDDFLQFRSPDELHCFDLNEVNETLEIDVTKYIGQTTKLSELIDDFYYLRLNPGYKILGDISKVIATNSTIILVDKDVTSSIAGFDIHSGELTFFIDHLGDGPEQYQSIYDVEIDENQNKILVFDGLKRKIHEYTLNGQYIGNKSTNVYFREFRFFNNTTITTSTRLYNEHVFRSDDLINFLWLDSTLNVFAYTDRTNPKSYVNEYTGLGYLNRYKEFISFVPPFTYNIHVFNTVNGQLFTPLSLKSSSQLWDTKQIRSLTYEELYRASLENPSKLLSLGRHFLSKDWTGLELEKFRGRGLLVFSRIDGSSYFVIDNLDSDLPGLIMFGFPDTSNDEWLISLTDPQSIRAFMQPEKIQEIKQRGLYNSKLDIFFQKNIDPEDPVLLFYKLKNKNQ